MMSRQRRQQQEEEEEEEEQKNKGEKVESDFDPKTMRKTKPGLKRLYLTLSLLFSFILGFPLVWKSVEIYRSRLPYDEIDALSKQLKSKKPPLFPSSHFHAVFLDYSSSSSSSSSVNNLNAGDLQRTIVARITKLTASQNYQCECGTLHRNFTLSVTTVDSSSDDDDDDDASVGGCTHSGGSSCLYESQCGAIRTFDFELFDDDAAVVDDAMESALGGGRQCLGSAYTVVVVVVNNTVVDAVDDEVRAVVGKYRHAWFVVGKGLLEMGLESLLDKVAEVFVKVFVNGGREDGLIHRGEFMPVGADGSIVLSFNLLNANPRDWIYDWDFERIEKTLLAPVIEALRPIASISVESQVLYHTPKSSFSSWDEKLGSYIFSTKELPFFVNSNEWHLDTSIAAGGQSKILQFVIYIPSAKECPLLLQLPDGELSMTNGFISPMWGGVMVWNPKTCLMDSDNKLPNRHIISPQDLQMIFEVFLGQFRQLFGLKSDSTYAGASGTYDLLASERGFTEWELDVLARQHLYFNLHSSATTLESLSRLVQSLPRMIIMDEIGKQVQFSLEAAKSAQGNASLGVYDASAVSSRQARSMAEDAFFHPSIMSVSYHSFEHCFAVYSPFFLPISMHVLLAAVRECRRYKIEKSKYLLWKAETKVGS